MWTNKRNAMATGSSAVDQDNNEREERPCRIPTKQADLFGKKITK